jgi:hypothetical protein
VRAAIRTMGGNIVRGAPMQQDGQTKAECADLRLMVHTVPCGEPLQSAHSENLTL